MNNIFSNKINHKSIDLFLLSIITISLFGCASTRLPVEEEELFSWFGFLNYSYLSTAPERRVVLFRYKDELICAEPPADAADQIGTLLNASLSAGKGSIEAKGQLLQEVATTIKQLNRRTQSLQLYRDRVSTLCMMLMNKMIDKEQYNTKESMAFSEAIRLLELELPAFYKTLPNTNDETPAPKLNSNNSQEETESKMDIPEGIKKIFKLD